jgi:molecular chaperone GrpE
MSDTDNSTVRVNDRRRFDPDGNPRPDAAEQAAPGQANPPQDDAACAPQEALVEPANEEIKRLEGELATARKRVDELARAYQASMQDREDFKARLTRERERMIEVEKGNVALALIEAIDELDLSLQASAQDTSPLAQGVRMIRENMLQKLARTGVERFDPVGSPFDPNTAEAADMEITSEPDEDQKVVAELRAGYRLKGRVIRPARVKVAKYVKPAQA